MSASSTPTVSPRAASAAARFTVTDDLPTPPLPLATARTRWWRSTSVASAFSRRVPAGAVHGRGLLLGRHLAVLDLHVGHAGEAEHLRLHLGLDLVAQRAPGRGQRHLDGDLAVGLDLDVVDHARAPRCSRGARDRSPRPASGARPPRWGAYGRRAGGRRRCGGGVGHRHHPNKTRVRLENMPGSGYRRWGGSGGAEGPGRRDPVRDVPRARHVHTSAVGPGAGRPARPARQHGPPPPRPAPRDRPGGGRGHAPRHRRPAPAPLLPRARRAVARLRPAGARAARRPSRRARRARGRQRPRTRPRSGSSGAPSSPAAPGPAAASPRSPTSSTGSASSPRSARATAPPRARSASSSSTARSASSPRPTPSSCATSTAGSARASSDPWAGEGLRSSRRCTTRSRAT